MASKARILAIVVAHTGEWSAQGIDCGNSFTLTTYRRYSDAIAFAADNERNVEPGAPIYRFDRCERDVVIDHAFKGPMADDKLPKRTICRLLDKPEAYVPGMELRSLDYVSRDVHVELAEAAGIPIERA
jgi:hypothetical protein